MKACVYHAEDGKNRWGYQEGTYKRLFDGFKNNVKKYGIDTIHLTLDGQEGWGDENKYYSNLNPRNVIYNREVCFVRFLTDAPDDVYWFTEPDARVLKPIPQIKDGIDLVLLYRPRDGVPMTPSFRIARKSALPFFIEVMEEMKKQPKDTWAWNGDSVAWNSMYKKIGSPKKLGLFRYKKINIEFRDYILYTAMDDSGIIRHYKGGNKQQLVNREAALR